MSVGVGTVEDDDGLAGIGTGGHEAAHGDVIGVEAEAYVLDIDQEDIELTHGGCRRAVIAAIV